MKNLFKYAAVQWKSMLAIIVILFVQAYCDLSLPAYTSDIVNVGIQQGGIEDQIPEAISVEEMDRLLLLSRRTISRLCWTHMIKMTVRMTRKHMY